MTCQHPNCSRHVHSVCTNHCRWSLCEDHINEHGKTLNLEFEEALQILIKPVNELSKSIDQRKQSLHATHQQEVDLLQQSHEKQLNQIDKQQQKMNHFQEQCSAIAERIIQMKTNEHSLTQEDFQHIERLIKQIRECQNSLTDKEDEPLPIHLQKSPPRTLHRCPLTSPNIYGLTPSHNIRLCSSKSKIRNLSEHLRVYHRLDVNYVDELVKAVTLKLDPMETIIFPSETKISDPGDRHPCPFYDTPEGGEIRCTPCPNYVNEKYLPIHLKIAHRLRLPQIREILSRQ